MYSGVPQKAARILREQYSRTAHNQSLLFVRSFAVMFNLQRPKSHNAMCPV
jgi:hypothetical protein